MKLLILTQAVDENNPILGFFVNWLKEFANSCESVVVICLFKGGYSLPDNVKVISLGKEGGVSRIKYLTRFYIAIWQERENYDAVFVHMNQVYVILGGILWRFLKKRIGFWYVHKQVSTQLKLAEKLADYIFTASKESFALNSNKIKILGHGIDINSFYPKDNHSSEMFKIIYVGRISPIKNQFLLVEALEKIVNLERIYDLRIKFIGESVSDIDKKYEIKIRDFINDKKLGGYINFMGAVPHEKIIKFYHQADLSINLSPTGGLDKTVLESMLCGIPVIIFNKSFIQEVGRYKEELILNNADPQELAHMIIRLKSQNKDAMKKELRETVAGKHNLKNLILNILKTYGNSASQ